MLLESHYLGQMQKESSMTFSAVMYGYAKWTWIAL